MRSRRVYRVQRSRQGLLLLKASVGNGTDKAIVLRLFADTGSSFTVLPVAVFEQLEIDLRNPQQTARIATGGGIVTVPIGNVPWFSCLGTRKEGFPIAALNLPKIAAIDGVLGMDFLVERQARIDVANAEISVLVTG